MTLFSNSKLYDFVIVGNGSLGLSLAYRLKKRDSRLKIAVIGPNSREGSATLAAGAMINCWAELAYGQFDDPALADRANLTINAFSLWDEFCHELSEDSGEVLEVKWGTYIINNALGSPHEWRNVDYIIKVMKERGVQHRILAGCDIPWLKPEPRGEITRVVWVPDGRIQTAPVLTAYKKALCLFGVHIIDDKAVEIDINKGTLWRSGDRGVKLSDGTIVKGKNLVLANGSYAQKLIDGVPELRKAVPRLLWGAGSALEVSLPEWVKKYGGIDRTVMDIDHVVRTVDRGGACGLHVVPLGDGEYYCGASSGVWFSPEQKARIHALHVLMRGITEEIHKAFFFAGASIRGPGFRPVSIDTFPLLGESNIPGIWFANGTKRDGFTCSPFIANELSHAMLGKKHHLPPRFLPARKLISYKTRIQAIDDHVDATIGGEYQHGLVLPPYAVANYRQASIDKARRIYDQRNLGNFGIHPEVIHLYENDDFFAEINHERDDFSAAINKERAAVDA
jgi:glycine/D-amino acid oxidase-like deaminating enzyme